MYKVPETEEERLDDFIEQIDEYMFLLICLKALDKEHKDYEMMKGKIQRKIELVDSRVQLLKSYLF